MRLDLFLSNNGLANSRTHAANLIDLGLVNVNGEPKTRSSYIVKETDVVTIDDTAFNTLGEIKLLGAFREFNPDVKNKVALDIGCSNGGFSRILLNNGVECLYALDVGECALPDDIVNDNRVVGYFNTNARDISKKDFEKSIDFITIDVSFISLKYILPVAYEVLNNGGEIIALIKPQFEIGKKSLTKTGILKSAELQNKVVKEIENFSKNLGFRVLNTIKAPHPFENKNQEYFIYLQKLK